MGRRVDIFKPLAVRLTSLGGGGLGPNLATGGSTGVIGEVGGPDQYRAGGLGGGGSVKPDLTDLFFHTAPSTAVCCL